MDENGRKTKNVMLAMYFKRRFKGGGDPLA